MAYRDGEGGGAEKCKRCRKVVGEGANALCCDMCDEWFHSGCEKVNKELYLILKKYKELDWYCRECKGQMRNATLEVKKIRQELEEVRQAMQEAKAQNNSDGVLKELRDMRKEINNLHRQPPDMEAVREYVDERLQEQDEINRKRKNLVLYNVPESTRQRGEERQDEDMGKCIDLIENSLQFEKDSIQVTKVMRLGYQREGKIRPMLIKLGCEEEKFEILRRAKYLKDETDPMKKKIGIAPDLTKKQREHDYQLRQELKQRRDQGETGLYIKNGQLFKAREDRRRVE